jgi:hypothetical protein
MMTWTMMKTLKRMQRKRRASCWGMRSWGMRRGSWVMVM